jgi:hypothetical protein
LALQNSWGLGVGLTTPSCKPIIVTKPSKKEGRPKHNPGCSAEEEEKKKKKKKKLRDINSIKRCYGD